MRLGVDHDQAGNVNPGSMRSGKERANLMHFIDPNELGGLHVIGGNDVTLGLVAGIYADTRSGYPQWAAIQSGLFGTDASIIPLSAAEHDDRSIRILYSAQELRDAPHRTPGTAMGRKQEANLFRHYGVGYGAAGPSAGRGAAPDAHTRRVGRTMLREHAVPSANQMS